MAVQPQPAAELDAMKRAALASGDLSWKALGLLFYLLSLPENEPPRIDELAVAHTDGRKATANGVAELKERGYLRIEALRHTGGRFTKARWYVTPNPSEPAATRVLAEEGDTQGEAAA